MRQDAWRAYLEMALGLTETSRKKATKAVQRVLGKGGVTAEQLTALAEELVRTGAANREAITTLVRSELDRALGRVGLATTDEVNALSTRIRELEAELREARARTAAPAADTLAAAPGTGAADRVIGVAATADAVSAGEPAVGGPAAPRRVAKKAVKRATGPAPGRVSTMDGSAGGGGGPGVDGARPALEPGGAGAGTPTPERVEAVKKTTAAKAAKKMATAKKTPAKKTPAKKTPAKKTPAKKTTAKKTTATKATAKETTAKKTTAKKAAKKTGGSGAGGGSGS